MNYAAVKPTDVANGPGVRVSLFVSGCTHRCPGCFNEVAWDFSYGEPFTGETVCEILNLLDHDYIAGLSLLGGEPFEPENQGAVLALVRQAKAQYPEKTVWCYSGYTFEELLERQDAAPADGGITRELLSLLDVLVDGRYAEAQKDLNLRFRGSANQRILDVKASLEDGCARWAEGYAH